MWFVVFEEPLRATLSEFNVFIGLANLAGVDPKMYSTPEREKKKNVLGKIRDA